MGQEGRLELLDEERNVGQHLLLANDSRGPEESFRDDSDKTTHY